MSTVSLPLGYTSALTAEYLRNLARRWNISFKSEEEEAAYLLLLQSAEAVHREVQDLPDFSEPNLQPIATSEDRLFWRPDPQANTHNAWSHRTCIRAAQPTSSLLEGRKIAVKDNISVGGLPTTVGAFATLVSRDAQFPISPIDATVVKRVLEAGGLIMGTATCEMYSAAPISSTSASGPVHNPWAYGYTSGGSSSGCGSLMGMNVIDPSQSNFGDRADLAIGSDQGGSIRIPASYNGVYGLKPTHGLVPYTGAMTLTPMIDHLGPMATSVKDIAVLLHVLAGYDGYDPRMTPESPLRSAVPDYPAILDEVQADQGSKLRVGILKEAFEIPSMSDEVRTGVYNAACEFFRAVGATVSEVSVPLHAQGPAIWTAATRVSMSDWGCQSLMPGFLSYVPPHIEFRWPPDQGMHDLLTDKNPSIMNLIFSATYLKESCPAQLVAKSHRKVFELRRAYDDALDKFDVLITPTTPTVAFPHPSGLTERVKAAVGIVANTCPFNVTGHPAMSVPCGFGGADPRLPFGMQIISRRWGEEKILRAAALFELGRELVDN
ncbi:putative amidase [Aspergillus vadensis CBS 113365]|uniref:Amidase n=1 Tax=Aspergillus vadensis (strain CBS 113365 / IMI 142717 / IBT 24658) TaxID=1448311 RepID=A0A319CIB8_ASPVC|nr:putative amidase [Aspergillus vadensis CBS 113365]PYH68002.1 putative amidase [Aspergillus vadensis CBS 113365]